MGRMVFTIREPGPRDAAAVADLHVATWREAYTHLLPDGFFTDEYIERRRRMWRDLLENPHADTTVRIAESDGSIIGLVWAGPGMRLGAEAPPRERQLYALYVAAAHHGTGAGQALLDEALGDGPAMLWVAAQNPRAIAFYRRNGFEFDGVEQTDPIAPSITDARMLR